MIEKKINHLDNHNYIVMEYSKIFLSMTDFMNLDTKYAIQEIENEKNKKKINMIIKIKLVSSLKIT